MRALQAQHAELPSALEAAETAAADAGAAGGGGAGAGIGRGATVTPFVREDRKVGRNEPCPCGSGRKYKQCHGLLSEG